MRKISYFASKCHILVQSNGLWLKAGQQLSDGTVPAQDILNILGHMQYNHT